MYEVEFADDWNVFFLKLDKPEQERVWKRILQLQTISRARHLHHGKPFFVVETGQFRICFRQEGMKRTVEFAGNHKQYEKWLRQ